MLPSNTNPETYGPPLRDYDEVVDPETEISATKLEALAVDVAAMTYVVPRAWAKVTAGRSPAIAAHSAVWGDAAAVEPTVASTDVGKHIVTWPAPTRNLNPTYSRQAESSVSIKTAIAQPHLTASATYADISTAVELTDTNVVTVITGNGSNFADYDFTVWIY